MFQGSCELFHAAGTGSNVQPEPQAGGGNSSSSSMVSAAPLQALELSLKYCGQDASRSSARSACRDAGTAQTAHTNITVLLTAPTTRGERGIKSTREDWVPINLKLKDQGALPRSWLPRWSNTNTLRLPSHLEKGHFHFPHLPASWLQEECGHTRRLINVLRSTECPQVTAWHGNWDLVPCATRPSAVSQRGCSLFSVPLQPY